jgi:uncharacterized cupin superfamily protein
MSKVIIRKLSPEDIENLGVHQWPIWEKEISRFDWKYDNEESCLILEGEFSVETDEGNFSVKAGDFVTFKQGLKCVWDISKPVRKHYMFK